MFQHTGSFANVQSSIAKGNKRRALGVSSANVIPVQIQKWFILLSTELATCNVMLRTSTIFLNLSFHHRWFFLYIQEVTHSTLNADNKVVLKEPFGKKSAPIPIIRNSKNVSKLYAPLSRKQLAQSKDARRTVGIQHLASRKTSQVATKQSNSIEARARSESFIANNSKTAYQYSGQADNIDERDSDDPLSAADYAEEMFAHFRENEKTTSVRPNYMEHQDEINTRMRAILVDWLVQVHHKFKMVPETLYLTVNLIDRYLEKRYVSRQELQLVGVASLLIASKYEEIYIPEMSDFVYICDNAYTLDEVSSWCFSFGL
jgi:hypothetical protein